MDATKRCRAFNSETKSIYIEQEAARRKPYRAKLHWGDENKIEVKVDKEAEIYARNLQLECYITTNQIFYNTARFEESSKGEETDFSHVMIQYLKKTYYTPPEVKNTRLPYSTTRITGFSNPQGLIFPFSSYRDGVGRTGGEIILSNHKKIMRAKKYAKVYDRLRANLFRGTEWTKNFEFPDEN